MIYLVFYFSPNFLLNLPTDDHLWLHQKIDNPKKKKKEKIRSCNLVTETSDRAGVNQQPPVHQLKMRPFKPFWR